MFFSNLFKRTSRVSNYRAEEAEEDSFVYIKCNTCNTCRPLRNSDVDEKGRVNPTPCECGGKNITKLSKSCMTAVNID